MSDTTSEKQFEDLEETFQTVEELQQAFEKRMSELTSAGIGDRITYSEYNEMVGTVQKAFYTYLRRFAA